MLLAVLVVTDNEFQIVGAALVKQYDWKNVTFSVAKIFLHIFRGWVVKTRSLLRICHVTFCTVMHGGKCILLWCSHGSYWNTDIWDNVRGDALRVQVSSRSGAWKRSECVWMEGERRSDGELSNWWLGESLRRRFSFSLRRSPHQSLLLVVRTYVRTRVHWWLFWSVGFVIRRF